MSTYQAALDMEMRLAVLTDMHMAAGAWPRVPGCSAVVRICAAFPCSATLQSPISRRAGASFRLRTSLMRCSWCCPTQRPLRVSGSRRLAITSDADDSSCGSKLPSDTKDFSIATRRPFTREKHTLGFFGDLRVDDKQRECIFLCLEVSYTR